MTHPGHGSARGATGLLMLAALLVVSGCSAGSHSAAAGASSPVSAAPRQKIVSGVGGVSVQVPDSWVAGSTRASSGTVLSYGSPDRVNGLPSQAVLVTLTNHPWPDVMAASLARATEVLGAVRGSVQLARKDATVAGAGPAKVTSMSFPLPGGVTGTLYDLVAVTPQNQELIVRVTVQAAPDAQRLADAILGSVRLGATT
ncbi:MAG: hypothetical protein QOE76_655 [Frankiales bacterium]|jgi:hypothetical protein|nr:hypothetical protein [Frankiales bacterium]